MSINIYIYINVYKHMYIYIIYKYIHIYISHCSLRCVRFHVHMQAHTQVSLHVQFITCAKPEICIQEIICRKFYCN